MSLTFELGSSPARVRNVRRMQNCRVVPGKIAILEVVDAAAPATATFTLTYEFGTPLAAAEVKYEPGRGFFTRRHPSDEWRHMGESEQVVSGRVYCHVYN